MSTAEDTRTYTPEEYLALSDRDFFELVSGRLIKRRFSLRAALVGGQLLFKLFRFVEDHELGWVFPAKSLYRCFADPDKIRRPVISFIRRARWSWAQMEVADYADFAPDLVVEVLTRDYPEEEVDDRVKEYLDAGVPLFWVLDPILRVIRIHRIDGTITILTERDELSGEDVIPGFRCPVAALFPPLPTA